MNHLSKPVYAVFLAVACGLLLYGAVLRYPLRTDLALPQLKGALLLVHGAQDRLINPEHCVRLQALARQAQCVVLAGAAHNDLQEFPTYTDALAAAFKTLPAQ